MDRTMTEGLDRWLTGNYGEDQIEGDAMDNRNNDPLQAALDKAEREHPGFVARLLRELARDCIDVGGTGPLVVLARLVPYDDDATGADGLYEWNPTDADLVALVTGEYERESDEAVAAAERRTEGE